MEYYAWNNTKSLNDEEKTKEETLLVGDDLGICHMYNFMKVWHTCSFKIGKLESE